MAGNDKEQLEFSYITGGNENGAAPLENSLSIFYKVKLHLPSKCLPRNETKF